MIFVNATESIGLILSSGTTSLTGEIVASLYLILLFIITLCFMFNIPLEFAAIIVLPLCISIAAFYSSFFLAVGLIGIYLSAIISRHWILR